MPTTHGSRLAELADAYRAALEARNAAAVDRMARAWLTAQQRVNVEMASLVSKIEAARLAGVTPSPAWLHQERRLAQLTETINASVREWLPHAQAETSHLANLAMAEAMEHAQALSREAARTGLPGLEAEFTDINPANLTQLLAHTAEGGPLHALLAGIGKDMADAATNVLIQGVTVGKGSAWITRNLASTLDIPRHRAETIARTEALRVYRETSRLTYASSNVVGSWVWTAAIDRRTCPACIVMDGTLHPVTETLDGHPRCRCAMVPRTKTWGEIDPSLADLPDTRPPVTLGKDWLTAQSPSVQRAVMGPGKWEAWKRGDMTLEDMVARTHSPEWGTMRRERSLIEIREGRNANWMPELDAPLKSRYTPEQREFAVDMFRNATPEKRAQWLKDYGPGGIQDDPGMFATIQRVEAELAAKPAFKPPWPTMDPEGWEEAMQRVNPRYAEGPEWQNNCSNCTTSWELRRRGYDVLAQSRREGRRLIDQMKDWGVPMEETLAGKMTALQADKAIAKLGEGARGCITVQWKEGGGHIFNWEVRDGKVHWIDAQTHRERDLADWRYRVKAHVYWVRLDDKPLTPELSDYLLDFSADPTTP